MSARRRTVANIPWEGAVPRAGHFVAMQSGNGYWRIDTVRLHRDGKGPVVAVTLFLVRQDADLPRGAVILPWDRLAPSDPAGPARVRQLAAGGANAIEQTRWRDPSDVIPNASRRPRQVQGWRRACVLRRLHRIPGSMVTAEHIAAADTLRMEADMALIGFTPVRDDGGGGNSGKPSTGPSVLAVAQAYAMSRVSRVLGAFTPRQVALLQAVVMDNHSVDAWAKAREPKVQPQLAMGMLIAILDMLVLAYESGGHAIAL